LHPFYDTIEFYDMSLTVEETMCIVSVIQVVAKLYKLNQQNVSFNIYRLALRKEFRASRYGIEGHMIDFGLQKKWRPGLDSRIT
jgi:carboxylate-amine ligase